MVKWNYELRTTNDEQRTTINNPPSTTNDLRCEHQPVPTWKACHAVRFVFHTLNVCRLEIEQIVGRPVERDDRVKRYERFLIRQCRRQARIRVGGYAVRI